MRQSIRVEHEPSHLYVCTCKETHAEKIVMVLELETPVVMHESDGNDMFRCFDYVRTKEEVMRGQTSAAVPQIPVQYQKTYEMYLYLDSEKHSWRLLPTCVFEDLVSGKPANFDPVFGIADNKDACGRSKWFFNTWCSLRNVIICTPDKYDGRCLYIFRTYTKVWDNPNKCLSNKRAVL